MSRKIDENGWLTYTTQDDQIEYAPVKRGRWDLIDGCEPMRYGCSVCHRMVWACENYCPKCGARMDGDENER